MIPTCIKFIIGIYGCVLLYRQIYYSGYYAGSRGVYNITTALIRNGHLPGFLLYYPGAHDNIRINFKIEGDGSLTGEHYQLQDLTKMTRFTCEVIDDVLLERIYRSYEKEKSSIV